MVYTPPPTWRPGELMTAFEMNLYVRDNLLELKKQWPSALVYNSVNVALPNNAYTYPGWNTQDHDSNGFHTLGQNQLTIPEAGVYELGGWGFTVEATPIAGSFQMGITLNDGGAPPANANWLGQDYVSPFNDTIRRLWVTVGARRYAAGDLLRCFFFNSNAGVGLTLPGVTTFGPYGHGFFIQQVGR